MRALARRCLVGPCFAGAVVEVAFTDDAAIAELNRRFLKHEGPTDVLAFPLEDDVPGGEDPTIGLVVVSVETARREARRRGLDVRAELALYVAHGFLHLAGYDDASPGERRRMRAMERRVLAAAGFARPAGAGRRRADAADGK